MRVRGVQGAPAFDELVHAHTQAAKTRLDGRGSAHSQAPLPEGQWPEVQAWRRVYSEMGLCVFRRSVTARFGIVTAEFGSVTDHFGDVTDRRLVPA
jgi:hypothetical protein